MVNKKGLIVIVVTSLLSACISTEQYHQGLILNSSGSSYGFSGQYQKAISCFNKAIQLNPKDSIAYYNRGIVYNSLREYKKAILDFSKSIKLDSKHSKAYIIRGSSYNVLGQFKKAILDFNKAIKINPKSSDAYTHCGISYSALKHHKKAVLLFNKAIELNIEANMIQQNYESLDERQKAISTFAGSYFLRGMHHKSMGKYRNAITDFNKALEIDPTHKGAFKNRQLTYQLLGVNTPLKLQQFKSSL